VNIRSKIRSLPLIRNLIRRLDNQFERDVFVIGQLEALPDGASILDAGCGSQRYRKNCNKLDYKSQDFGAYHKDEKDTFGTNMLGGDGGYEYGAIDYLGNIWNIDEKPDSFDVILCTEVFEHIPLPNETIAEFSRLLKSGGQLILTAPSNCLRHMDPYFFYSGFSDRWYEYILAQNGFELIKIEPVGDYFSWMSVEIFRTMRHNSPFSWLALLPAFVFYLLKRKSAPSINTLCMGYHVLAKKI
jgi:SAM-dependent methyltransferase